MNAAFLLVTSACLMGQVADKKVVVTSQPAPIVSSSSSCGGSCGGGCDTCGEAGFGHRLRDKLRGMFSRDCNDGCQTCGSHHHHHHVKSCAPTCAPAPACNTCDTCNEGGFLSRLRGRFRHGDCGCDGGCSTGGCANGACGPTVAPGAAPGISAPAGERIESPKKMPPAPAKQEAPKKQEVRINNAPAPISQSVIQPTAIPAIPSAPIVEVVPVPAPRADADRRDPF